MRKHQQRQILELIQTLKEAQALKMYANCQNGALRIGEFIEYIAGGRGQTIALLEEYCRLLRKASEGKIGEEPLRKHLIEVENSVNSELKPNKIEIAFLSYKASMADSIESIYLAAKNDPKCDAFWIPIPYFERKPDGTLGTMRHEGTGCYPDHIECTDWREYDIKARHPDAIFTFAPFDDGNIVTMVHPVFHCKYLRALTDMLCYVPYIIHSEMVSSNFATVPGVLFSHRTIVQSEHVRKQYIDSVLNVYPSLDKKTVGDNIIARGTPKCDKVVNSRREDFILPKEWEKLLDGKKVIFYNTTIGAILQGNEQYLKKIVSVLDTFRKYDDAVLWWRPHPLSDATYGAMRPQLLDAYKEIVSAYRREAWGIYDDSPDLHRAIAYADACYGDESSVNLLFQIAGKPTLIQNVNNAGSESSTLVDADSVEKAMKIFVSKQGHNSFVMYEATDLTKGGFNLICFIKHLNVIMKYSEAQSAKYRALLMHADGTAGKKIYEYITSQIGSGNIL
jgi:hypothetical protein